MAPQTSKQILQFGHGSEAVETGRERNEPEGFESLQFGHGSEAVETFLVNFV